MISKTFMEVNKNKNLKPVWIISSFTNFKFQIIFFIYCPQKKNVLSYLNVFPKTNCLPHQCSKAPQPETISLEMDWPNSAVKRSMDHAKVPVDPAMPGKR